MKLITIMLVRMIMLRFMVILLGITAFVLTLEVVGYIKDILTINPSAFTAIGSYIILRTPAILSTFLQMSLLLAILLTITELTYRNEMTVIWASGVSPLRLIVMLLPVALLVGGFHFLLMEQAVPRAAPQLRQWAIGDYAAKRLNVSENDPIWLRAGPDIMRATHVSGDGRLMSGVIVFRRDDQGLLKEQIFADNAAEEQGRWLLKKVVVYYAGGQKPTRLDSLIYDGAMRPASSSRTGDPEEMTLSDLNYFIANDGFGIRPAYVYKTWWHKRLTPFFVAVVMIGVCVPMATRFKRGGGLGLLFGFGVGLGFLYFVGDGIAATLGEVGVVSPWLAAWAPVMIFGAIAGALLARTEYT